MQALFVLARSDFMSWHVHKRYKYAVSQKYRLFWRFVCKREYLPILRYQQGLSGRERVLKLV